jgi:hypothetical protein
MTDTKVLSCEVCGRFIAYQDFDTGCAVHRLVYPDSAYTVETWETYHRVCERQEAPHGEG